MLTNIKNKIFYCPILSFVYLVYAQTASAQIIDPSATKIQTLPDEMQLASGYSPFTIGQVMASLISAVLGFLGVIFIVLILSAGFKWMTAGGNEENVKKAQETLKRATIGLIIILASYAITYTIFNQLPFSVSSGGGMPNPT